MIQGKKTYFKLIAAIITVDSSIYIIMGLLEVDEKLFLLKSMKNLHIRR